MDNLSITSGRHTIKAGGPINGSSSTRRSGAPQRQLRFTGVYTSPPPVSTPTRRLLSRTRCSAFQPPTACRLPYEQRLRYSNAALYFQEDWRATSLLTLNLGLRWEYFGKPMIFSIDRHFDLATGQQLLPGQNGTPRSLINADMNNFGPRFGFAADARQTELVVRGAYGVFYSPPIGNDFRSRGFQDPFAFLVTRTYRPASTTSPLPEFTAADPLAGATVRRILTRAGVDRNLRDAYVQQWNLSIQK